MFNLIPVNIATGITVVLFTSWYIWRRREKLILNYTVTESDFFPFHNEQGKYYAVKIVNNGGKLIKNLTVDISISHAVIEAVTSHELMKSVEREIDRVKFTADILNPKEEISFVITAKVDEMSMPKIKVRSEGVNGEKKLHSSNSPSKVDIGSTAIIFTLIGFFGTIIYANVMSDTKVNDRMSNIFVLLNKAGLPHVFHRILEHHNDITYEGTAFYLVNSSLKDDANRSKYVAALKNITEIENISEISKGVACYLIYKLDTQSKNIIEANKYLEKCKEDTPDVYEYFMEHDQTYNLDSVKVKMSIFP